MRTQPAPAALNRRTVLRRWASAFGLTAALRLISPFEALAPRASVSFAYGAPLPRSTDVLIRSESVQLRMQFDESGGRFGIESLKAFGNVWAQSSEAGPGALWIDDVRVEGDRLGSIDGSSGLLLVASRPSTMALAHAASGLQIRLEFQAEAGNAITQRAMLANGRRDGSISIGSAATISYGLIVGDWIEALSTDDAPGQWTQNRARLPAGFGNHGLRAAERGVYPLVRLESESGDGVIVAVNSATAWRVDVDLQDSLRMLRAGEYRSDLRLGPGEQATLPSVVTIFYQDGLDGAVSCLHRYLESVSAPRPVGWVTPPAIFNTWFGYGTAVGDDGAEGSLLRYMARQAASVGVEAFVVDAGWYLGNPIPDMRSPRSRGPETEEDHETPQPQINVSPDLLLLPAKDDFDTGLGTWIENPDKWTARPGDGGSLNFGLRNFSDYIHNLGVLRPDGSTVGKMKFGLWIEPERFDAELDLPERVPSEWATAGAPILDFTRPEVVAGITERIQRMIDSYRVDYLKLDANLGVGPEPKYGRSGHFWTVYSAGLEQFYDNLRQANPGLYIEHCAAGLKRYWIGMPRIAHGTWLDDDVQVDRVTRLLDATDALMLPRHKTVLVTEDLSRYNTEPPDESGVETGSDGVADMVQVVRTYWGGDRRNGGTIGFSDRIELWGAEQLTAAREALEIWKREIRGRG